MASWYDAEDFAALLSLLNNLNSHVQQFMDLINYRGEGITYFQNFANYHGKILELQYLTNAQEHFIPKLKAFCTI